MGLLTELAVVPVYNPPGEQLAWSTDPPLTGKPCLVTGDFSSHTTISHHYSSNGKEVEKWQQLDHALRVQGRMSTLYALGHSCSADADIDGRGFPVDISNPPLRELGRWQNSSMDLAASTPGARSI